MATSNTILANAFMFLMFGENMLIFTIHEANPVEESSPLLLG